MGTYDVLMLLVVLVAAFMGWQKGMAWQIASIAAIVGSYFAAMQFRDVVSAKINLPPPMNTFAAMLVVYLGCSVAIWTIFRVVRSSIEQMKLGDFDRQMGALVGAAKGALIACLITLFAVAMLPEAQSEEVISSKSGYFIAKFLNEANAIMPAEVQEILGPQLENFGRAGGHDTFAAPKNPFIRPPQNGLQQATAPPTAHRPILPPSQPQSVPVQPPQYTPPGTGGGTFWPPRNSANSPANPDGWR